MALTLVLLIVVGLCELALLLLLAAYGHSRHYLAETISLYVFATIFYIFAVYIALQLAKKAGSTRLGSQSPRLTLAVLVLSLLFRIVSFPPLSPFSDDLFRYRWEGKLQAAGGNPYHHTPIDAEWATLRDDTFPHIVGKDLPSVYGPLLELLNHGTYRIASVFSEDSTSQLYWFKLPAIVFDLATVFLMLFGFSGYGRPVTRLVVYGWAPVTVVEFWANGHNDSVSVFLTSLGLHLALRSRRLASNLSIFLAGLAKIWPLVLVPFTLSTRQRLLEFWKYSLLFPALVVFFFLPYGFDLLKNAQLLSGFLGGWRNNDSIFGLVFAITGDVYLAKYTSFALILVTVAIVLLARVDLVTGSLLAVCSMLLFSANCHMWYLTWLLPMLSLKPVSPIFLWLALMPFNYLPLIDWYYLGLWDGSRPERWLVYGPLFLYSAGWLVWKKLRQKPSPSL